MIPATPASRRRPFFFVAPFCTFSLGLAILFTAYEDLTTEINAFSWQTSLCADSGQKTFPEEGEPFQRSGGL